jgi:hypothetical protein
MVRPLFGWWFKIYMYIGPTVCTEVYDYKLDGVYSMVHDRANS